MNFVEACKEARENGKIYENEWIRIESPKGSSMFTILASEQSRSFFVADCSRCTYSLTITDIIGFCQGDFHEVVDWGKVKIGTAIDFHFNSIQKRGYYYGLTTNGNIKVAVEDGNVWGVDCVRLAEEKE